jgi:hypothetical protein
MGGRPDASNPKAKAFPKSTFAMLTFLLKTAARISPSSS